MSTDTEPLMARIRAWLFRMWKGTPREPPAPSAASEYQNKLAELHALYLDKGNNPKQIEQIAELLNKRSSVKF